MVVVVDDDDDDGALVEEVDKAAIDVVVGGMRSIPLCSCDVDGVRGKGITELPPCIEEGRGLQQEKG